MQVGGESLRESRKLSAAESDKPRAELGRRAEADSEEDIYSEIDDSARAPSTLMNVTGRHQNQTLTSLPPVTRASPKLSHQHKRS